METRGRARATIARRLCTISGFYRYAVEEELLDHSPAVHVRRPRLDQSHAIAPDRNEVGALLGKIVTIPLAPRTARAIDLAIGERLAGPIFLRPGGARMDRHCASRIVRRVARRAGVDKPIGLHLQHPVLAAQFGQLFALVGAETGLATLVDFGLRHPPPQTRLGDTEILRDLRDRLLT